MDFLPDLLEHSDLTAPAAAEKRDLRLKPEFALDGTHMNPSYLHLVEAALNKLAPTKSGKR